MDAVVCGVGSGGTITGLSRFFARVAPAGRDRAGRSGRLGAGRLYRRPADWARPARGWSKGSARIFCRRSPILSRVRTAYSISDAESLATARDLLKQEGILAGSSSGTLVAAALHYCRQQTQPKRVVTLVCDSGGKYLSKMFNDYWMADQGFLTTAAYGDLRDLISHRFADGAVVSVGPDDPLNVVYARMRLHDVSQLPVLARGRDRGHRRRVRRVAGRHGRRRCFRAAGAAST